MFSMARRFRHVLNVVRYLKPSVGQIELVELDWTPRSHPAPFPDDSLAMHEWWEAMKSASNRAGLPMEYREDTEQMLEYAGFVDVNRRKIRIPFWSNPEDRYECGVNEWYRAAMCHRENVPERQAFVGLSIGLLTHHLGWSEAAVREICQRVTEVINRKKTPLYHNLYILTARRPRS